MATTALPDVLATVWPPSPKDEFVKVGRCRHSGREITICYNAFGKPSDPCILLIMGLACPGPYWDSRFCTMLANAGYFVIRYDNRDSGLSTHLDDLKEPNIFRLALPRWLSLFEGKVPYFIDNMADDAVGLLDALGISQVSLVGCSLGGAIAQSIVIRYPERVRSLCLLSTSSGVPMPEPRILLGLLDHAKDSSTEAILDYKVRNFRSLAGKLPFPTEEFRAGMRWTVERSNYEGGKGRQLTAMARSPDRSNQLLQVNAAYRPSVAAKGNGFLSLVRDVALWGYCCVCPGGFNAKATRAVSAAADPKRPPFIPVLILHGGSDPIIPPSNAEKLASLLVGAKLVLFPEMGHYFPSSMFEPLTQEILLNVKHGQHIGSP